MQSSQNTAQLWGRVNSVPVTKFWVPQLTENF